MPDRPSPQAAADDVRAFIGETAQRAAIYAAHAIDYAAIGDDRGLARSLRLLATCAVSGSECLPLLSDAVARETTLREAVRTVYGQPAKAGPREASPTTDRSEEWL